MYYEDANGQIRHSENSQAIMIQSAESLAALSAKFGSGIVVPRADRLHPPGIRACGS